MNIEHVTDGAEGAFVISKGTERIAEMVYRRDNATQITIDHTWTADELRGQGIARKLLDTLVGWARAEHVKIVPQCTYAKSQFDKDASLADLLAG